MQLKRTLLFSALACHCLPLFAAAPTVSSATLSSGAITITGTNFGSKPTAAPFHWQPFTALAQGSTPTQAGFLDVGGGPGDGGSTYVDANGFASGIGALRHDTGPGEQTDDDVSESFPHIVSELPSGTSLVHRSFWFKAVRTVSGAPAHKTSLQIKSVRSGVTDEGDNTPYYSGNPRQTTSIYLNDTTRGFEGLFSCWWDTTSGSDGEAHYDWGDTPTWNTDGWNYYEVTEGFNSVGSANGILRVRVNGDLIMNRTDTQPRLVGTDYLEYVSLLPGIDFTWGDQWAISYAQIYTDTSQARVVLTDNAVYGSSTKFAPQIPTAWTGTSITVTPNTTGFTASSTAYLHVFNTNGEAIASGYAYVIPVPCTP